MATAPKDRAVRRICKLLQILKGHALDGLALTEITKALNDGSASTVLRTLQTLADESMVIQHDTGRWSLSVLMLQIAEATSNEFSRKSTRMAEIKMRIKAGASD